MKPGGGGQHHVAPADVAQQRVHRVVDHEADPHDRGEVHAGVHGLEDAQHQVLLRHAALYELDPLRADQVLDVVDPAGTEVVEDDDLMAVGGQAVGEVGTNETGSARDQILQLRVLFSESSV